MSFLDDIHAVSDRRASKSDVMGYFKGLYPETTTIIKSGKNKGQERTNRPWVAKAAEAISGTSDKKSRAYQSAMRNFQERKTQVAKTAKEKTMKWKGVGDTLPLKAPPCGYHVQGTVWILYSDECVDREVDFDITGDDADTLAAMGGESQAVQGIINLYNEMDIDDRQGYAACKEPELTVIRIECDE